MAQLQLSEHGQPVHVRHYEIEKDKRELIAARPIQEIERGLSAGSSYNRHPGACDRRFQQSALYRIVVHNEYGLGHQVL
jgi:hypothetical protein